MEHTIFWIFVKIHVKDSMLILTQTPTPSLQPKAPNFVNIKVKQMLKLNKTIKLAIYCPSPKIVVDRKQLVSLAYLKKDFWTNLFMSRLIPGVVDTNRSELL